MAIQLAARPSGPSARSTEVACGLFDGNGNVTASTDARGYTTNFDYDGAGRETEEIDASPDGTAGRPTTYYAYDNDGHLTSVTDPRGAVTEYEYDAAGRETEEIDPDPATGAASGPTITYAYNLAGEVGSLSYAPGVSVTYDYDALGRETDEIRPSGSGNLTDSYTYYADGNLESETDPYGDTSTYAYDNLGELIASTDAFGTVTGYQYDVLGQQIETTQTVPGDTSLDATTSQTTYDALGDVLTQTDAASNTTTYAYNGFRELAIQTDPDEGTTDYSYDADGDVTSLTDPDVNSTYYTYNHLDEETSESETVALSIHHSGDAVPTGDSVDSDGNLVTTATTSYQYDADGNVVETTDPDGKVTLDSYDYLNRVSEEKWFNDATDANAWISDHADDASTNTIDYTYNGAGDVLTANDDFSSYTYTYEDGDLHTVDNNGVNAAVSGGVPDVELTYGYNSHNQLESMDATLGGTDDFQDSYSYYSDTNLLETIEQTSATSDGADAVADKRVDFSYTTGGELYTVDRYSDLSASTLVVGSQYGYDALGRLTSLEHATAGATTIYEDYSWTYNATNQIHTVSNSAHSADNATYTYDGNGELAGTSYDANGNPNGDGDVVGAGNRLLSDGTNDYTFDADGNMTEQKNISTGAEIDYSYDNANRMTEVVEKDGSGTITDEIAYTYDMYGDLIGRKETPYTDGEPGTSTTQTFVYDPLNNTVVLQFDGSGNLTDRYLWNPNGTNQILSDEKVTSLDTAGDVYWPLNDNQGSVVDVVATDGTLENHTAYSPFGAATPTEQAVDEIFGAYGELTDPTLDDLIEQYRVDNTALGRWQTTDRIGFGAGDANLYRDVFNDPVNLFDPSGQAALGYGPEANAFSPSNAAIAIGAQAGEPAIGIGSPFDCGCPKDNTEISHGNGPGAGAGSDAGDPVIGPGAAPAFQLPDNMSIGPAPPRSLGRKIGDWFSHLWNDDPQDPGHWANVGGTNESPMWVDGPDFTPASAAVGNLLHHGAMPIGKGAKNVVTLPYNVVVHPIDTAEGMVMGPVNFLNNQNPNTSQNIDSLLEFGTSIYVGGRILGPKSAEGISPDVHAGSGLPRSLHNLAVDVVSGRSCRLQALRYLTPEQINQMAAFFRRAAMEVKPGAEGAFDFNMARARYLEQGGAEPPGNLNQFRGQQGR